jgi:hypothetical protein
MTATQTSTPTPPASIPSGKIAVVKAAPNGASFTCVVDGITIGTSKHKDYFEFHKRRGDIARLNSLDIGKFIYVDNAGTITEQKKVDGFQVRGNVASAIKHALENPIPAPVGFNGQTHEQAQENGRKGASARHVVVDISRVSPKSAISDDLRQQQIENGRKGAQRAAELRAQAAVAPVQAAPAKRAGRPRKDVAVH